MCADEELPGEKQEEPEQPVEPAPEPRVERATAPRPRPTPGVRLWDIGKEGVPGSNIKHTKNCCFCFSSYRDYYCRALLLFEFRLVLHN